MSECVLLKILLLKYGEIRKSQIVVERRGALGAVIEEIRLDIPKIFDIFALFLCDADTFAPTSIGSSEFQSADYSGVVVESRPVLRDEDSRGATGATEFG